MGLGLVNNIAQSGALNRDPRIQAVLAAIRQHESGGNYTIQNPNPGQTASGAYQFINSTWQNLLRQMGRSDLASQYPAAKLAPPALQDEVAYHHAKAAYDRYGKLEAIPSVWYVGSYNPGSGGSTPSPGAGNTKSVDKFVGDIMGMAQSGEGGSFQVDPNLYQPVDSQMLAMMRQLGFSREEAERQAAAAREGVRAQLRLNIGDLKQAGKIDRRNISGGMESRGVFRSGEHLRGLAEQRADQERGIAQQRTDAANQIGGIQSGYRSTLSDIARQRAESQLGLLQRIEDRNVEQAFGDYQHNVLKESVG